MKRSGVKKNGAKRDDPLRAYRFTSMIRHLISAFYGVLLGYAIMAGNPVVNYFVGVMSAIMAYIFFKTLAGKFLVKVRLNPVEPDIVRESPGVIVAKIRNYSPFSFPVSYIFIKDNAFPDGQRIFFFVKPFANLSMAFPMRFDHCGTYPLLPESVRLISAGGMVWAKVVQSKKKQTQVAVVPEIYQAVIDHPAGEGSGELSTSVKPSVSATDSVYIRQYAPGDDPRFIHWKRSASREDWLLRSFYQEGEHNYIVYFDTHVPGGIRRDMAIYKEPFDLDENATKALTLADKLSAAVVSIATTLYNNGMPFYFACPSDASSSDTVPSVVLCDSAVALDSIRQTAGTIDFAASRRIQAENNASGLLTAADNDPASFDSGMISYLASSFPASDNGVSIIRVCAGSSLPLTSFESDDPFFDNDPSAGNNWLADKARSDSHVSSVPSADNSRRVRLSAADFSISGLPEAECYAEQFPGAFIITVEVKS
jgi:uncharacterized protein (DUF58 family)